MAEYKLVESYEELASLLEPLITTRCLYAIDIETGYYGEPKDGYSLHPETAFIVGFSFCSSLDAAYYVPLAHDMYPGNLDPKQIAPLLWQLLNTGMSIIANAKFELRQLSSFFRKHLSDHPLYAEQVRADNGYFPVQADVFLMAYCLAEDQQFGLKFLTKKIYDHQMTELHELFPDLPKNKQKTLRFNTLELSEEVISYACEDSYWTWRLYYDLVPNCLGSSRDDRHARFRNFESIYSIEMNVLRAVCATEDFGISVDWGVIAKAAHEGKVFQDRLNLEIQEELSELLGEPVSVNLTSPKQMSELLYEKFNLETNRFTKSTRNTSAPKMSTDEQTLVILSEKLPVLKKVIQWREMKTLLTRYLVNYETKYSYAEDGNLHPDLFAAGTITGRFSAANPNYQQLPKRYYFKLNDAKIVDRAHEEAHGGNFPEDDRRGIEDKCPCGEFPYPENSVFDFNFRNAIIAPEGYVIFGYDLSQAELRAIAGEANERAMLEAFIVGEDVHKKTASFMLHKPLDQITPKERDVRGKTLNFALVYGLSAKSLGERLGISEQEANKQFERYYEIYPNIQNWQKAQIAKTVNGFVYSKFGRRIPLWDLESTKRWIRAKADRVAVNGPIQGGATGDYMKIAMAEIHKVLWNSKFRDTVFMVMNNHDALDFYVRDDVDLNEVYELLNPIATRPVEGWAPMVAEWHVGRRWGSMEEFKGVTPPKITDTATPEPEPEEEPEVIQESRMVIVQMTSMPAFAKYKEFVEFLHGRDGNNRVKVVIPEGEQVLDGLFGLTTEDQKEVSNILNGARVYYASDKVDKAELLKTLGL